MGFAHLSCALLSQKDALQWSRSPAAVEGEEPEDTADVESCGSNEASTVSGENDGKYPSWDGPRASHSCWQLTFISLSPSFS